MASVDTFFVFVRNSMQLPNYANLPPGLHISPVQRSDQARLVGNKDNTGIATILRADHRATSAGVIPLLPFVSGNTHMVFQLNCGPNEEWGDIEYGYRGANG
jgi:hypothetical protein